jgi:hypothetical protein
MRPESADLDPHPERPAAVGVTDCRHVGESDRELAPPGSCGVQLQVAATGFLPNHAASTFAV